MESKSKNTPRTRREPSHFSLCSSSSDCVAAPKAPKNPLFFSLCYWSKSLQRYLPISAALSSFYFPFPPTVDPKISLFFLPFFCCFFFLLFFFSFFCSADPKISASFLSFFCCFSSFFFFPFFCSADPKILLLSFHFSAVSLFLLLFPFSFLFLLFTCACLLFDSRSSCCLPFSPAHSSLSSFLFLLPALL